jgi:hypothetical protein
MATEKIDLTAPAEPVGATAEDTQKTVAAAEAADADTTEDNPGQGSMLADGLNDRFADELWRPTRPGSKWARRAPRSRLPTMPLRHRRRLRWLP